MYLRAHPPLPAPGDAPAPTSGRALKLTQHRVQTAINKNINKTKKMFILYSKNHSEIFKYELLNPPSHSKQG